MSKLDDIFNKFGQETRNGSVTLVWTDKQLLLGAKSDVKALMLELIPEPNVDLAQFVRDSKGWIETVAVDPANLGDKDLAELYRLAVHFKQVVIDELRRRVESL